MPLSQQSSHIGALLPRFFCAPQAAQHGMKRVVLVVGRGHVPGVVYALLHPYRMRKANREWQEQQRAKQAAGAEREAMAKLGQKQ